MEASVLAEEVTEPSRGPASEVTRIDWADRAREGSGVSRNPSHESATKLCF